MAHTSLHFGAVDVMFGRDGKAYCAEVNTGPFTTPYYQKRTALAFDYMTENPPLKPLPVTADSKNWRDYLHPSLNERTA
jgi:hypothetical protein